MTMLQLVELTENIPLNI